MLGVRGATPGKEKYRTLYTSIDERASESARGGVCVCVCVCVCALAPPPRRAGGGCLVQCSRFTSVRIYMLLSFFGMVLFLYFISGGIWYGGILPRWCVLFD